MTTITKDELQAMWIAEQVRKQDETIKNLSIYGLSNRLFFVGKFSRKDATMDTPTTIAVILNIVGTPMTR